MKIITCASVPDGLVQAWLQHLRNFDAAHPGCHFEVLVHCDDMTTAEVVQAMQTSPPFDSVTVIEKKDREDAPH